MEHNVSIESREMNQWQLHLLCLEKTIPKSFVKGQGKTFQLFKTGRNVMKMWYAYSSKLVSIWNR